ncbi:MAG: carbohydrate kinase family protein [Candidatus Thermoplasmatota archaeon]|nr:carbohydrate kinase family protein [Candidatus Thermoplasmatota archaeon]MBS3790091.1 carbohydrate kinase family protein [Candidatus Thermoplasmatota archaeon]
MNLYLGVFGHTALDVILKVPNLPEKDSSIAVESRVVRYGGTAANIARAAAEMDVDVSLASFVGDDFPEDYLNSLKESGVCTYDLKNMEGYNTPTCWIVNDAKGEQITIIDQAVMDHAESFELATRTMNECDILHIGTGKPDYYEKIFERTDSEKKTIAFDPAQELEYVYEPSTFEKFLRKSDYFFCNKKELKVALNYLNEDTPQGILKYVDTLVVTKGAEGSSLYLSDEKVDIPAYEPQEVVEPTGAGDAFRAGFYAGLDRGMPLVECCKTGSARASFSVECSGPQDNLVNWEEVRDRFEKID